MNFEGLVGQNEIKSSLKNSISKDNCAHAYLFTGPEGIGKSSFAMDFSQMLICEEDGARACGTCTSCTTFIAGANPDFHIIESDGNSISVDSIRVIQSDAIIRPMYSKKKVYFIKQAEKMTQQAQNSLLKTLEEPPSYCVIILTTHNPEMLIPTVKSRVLKYSFKKNTSDEINEILKLNNVDDKSLNFINAYADGIPGLALKIAGSEEFTDIRQKVFHNLNQLMSKNVKAKFDMAKFIIQNSDNSEVILSLLTCFYRDLLIVKKCKNLKLLINSDKEDMIIEYSKKISSERICKIITDIEEIRLHINQNANIELAADVLIMRLQEE